MNMRAAEATLPPVPQQSRFTIAAVSIASEFLTWREIVGQDENRTALLASRDVTR
jgi:hypothetical protein